MRYVVTIDYEPQLSAAESETVRRAIARAIHREMANCGLTSADCEAELQHWDVTQAPDAPSA